MLVLVPVFLSVLVRVLACPPVLQGGQREATPRVGSTLCPALGEKQFPWRLRAASPFDRWGLHAGGSTLGDVASVGRRGCPGPRALEETSRKLERPGRVFTKWGLPVSLEGDLLYCFLSSLSPSSPCLALAPSLPVIILSLALVPLVHTASPFMLLSHPQPLQP